jgi:rubrerythrin
MGVDGTVDRQAISRAQWFERGAALAAGLASGGILAGGLASLARSSALPAQDVEALNLALAFEELQADFYSRAAQALRLQADWAQFAHVVGSHERAHVTFLRRILGARAKAAPSMQLIQAPADPAAFQRVAVKLEDLGVAAYNGQSGNLTKASLAAVAKIVSVEARHAGWARDLAGELPAPVAVDPGVDEAQFKARLSQLGVKVG